MHIQSRAKSYYFVLLLRLGAHTHCIMTGFISASSCVHTTYAVYMNKKVSTNFKCMCALFSMKSAKA